jgi:hypothetical protein
MIYFYNLKDIFITNVELKEPIYMHFVLFLIFVMIIDLLFGRLILWLVLATDSATNYIIKKNVKESLKS